MSRQLRVLLVEDNPGDADLIRDLLSRDGSTTFEVTHTLRLETALGLVAAEDFDLVLLDLSLPDSAGVETVRAVRQRVPDIPVVVLTGQDDERVGLAAVHEGAQDYLVKGQVTGALVSRVLRYAIERHQNSLRLRESEERLSFALEASRTGAWDFDLGDLTRRLGFRPRGLDLPTFARARPNLRL
jgi:DNA-binding response OmpR family regulator